MQRRKWMCIAAGMLCALLLCGCTYQLDASKSLLADIGISCYINEQDTPDAVAGRIAKQLVYSAVLEVSLLWEQPVTDADGSQWQRYLAWVHRVAKGTVPGVHGGQLIWLESPNGTRETGQRYFFQVGCFESIHHGRKYVLASPTALYWVVDQRGNLSPPAWAAESKKFKRYEEATRPENLSEEMRPYALPTTRAEMLEYLQRLERLVQDGEGYVPAYTYMDYTSPGYLEYNTLRQAVAYSHVIVRGQVEEYRESSEPHWPDEIIIAVSTDGMLKGRWPIETIGINVFPGQVEAGKEYLFLLRCDPRYETARDQYYGLYHLAARNHAVIPVTRGAKVARVYRALGLEMPQE